MLFCFKKALIIELYENMKVRWEQGAYIDFLGRLFRFEEAVYYYLIFKKNKTLYQILSKYESS
ncbi:MAG: hypothetical protein CVT89_05780 [Candidatus Altiarchaeales archaeon HGW-Altiarchaeales-2]|nr:MAG: hypothetical protein CVT89_05780 [Candidatus Altiarchaeales archaeon HGW-Altiarchaeales-2]